MKFSERIYLFRVKNNLTQDELGKLIGLAKENISKLENGKYEPSRRILMKMDLLEKGE
ncbi:MAG TPA: helix-turn-helix transcriptional regulator [Lachnospiraceae bacterium]|nr:helix-turn-helix transcriptional regulator [Lachnospiraceae bacterium]